VLLQKMARDRLARARYDGALSTLTQGVLPPLLGGGSAAAKVEARAALGLARALSTGGEALPLAWEREWRQVYALAEAVCSTHLAESGAAGRGRLFAETLLPPGGESVAVVVTARL